MAITQLVSNGQLVETATTSSSTSSSSSSSTEYDSEMFLKLLVAEMEYQDPLEPTSNTEWVSQMASFSQIEEIQNMESEMQSMQASDLVGEYVILKTTDSSGNTSYVSGTVDYVYYEEGEAYLSVNDSLYSIDTLDTVANQTYVVANEKATTFENTVSKLPSVANLTTADASALENARALLDDMDDYQLSFVSSDSVSTLEKLEERMKALKILQGDAD